MAPIARLSKDIKKRSQQVENAGVRLVRAIGKKALKNLIYATPVDKGEARSNWRIGVGGTPTAVISPYSPGRNLGIGERGNARGAIAAGFARINSLKPGQGRRLKTSLVIVNNAKHIGLLNDGRSKQAAPGFIGRAVAASGASVLPNFKIFVPSGTTPGEDSE